MKFRLCCLIALALLYLTACGTEADDYGHDDESASLADLRWASEDERNSGLVKPFSYLVAFRDDNSRSASHYSSPVLQRRFHESWLAQLQGMARQRYLASLDLAQPGRSFIKEQQLPKSPPYQFFWDKTHIPAQKAHITQVDFNSEEEARRSIENWYKKGLIWYAEPNYISKLESEFEDNLIANFNDPETFPWLDQIDFIPAIQSFRDSPPNDRPVIAVMDSGIDVLHSALRERVFLNEQGQNKICRDDLYGCNTTVSYKDQLGDGAAYPAGTSAFGERCSSRGHCWHGTHVAGIIAGDGDTQYTGICPYCRILNVKVVDLKIENGQETFSIQDSSIIAGLAYVSGFTSNGQPLVRVINASFGKFQRSRSVEVFIRSMRDFGPGILVVAAAGNEDTMKRQYPAAFDDVLAVANVRSNSIFPQKSPSSNFGVWVDIAAPGDGNCTETELGGFQISGSGILSSAPGESSGCLTGTSMASPVVAGVAGLILAREPNISYDQLRSRLVRSAKADELYRDNVNNAYRPAIEGQQLVPLLGSGVVNAYYATNPDVPKSPAVLAERVEIVRPGCAVVGLASQETSYPAAWLAVMLFCLPLLSIFLGRR